MDWVGPATTGAVAIAIGVYLDRRAQRRGAIAAEDLRRILLGGGIGLLVVGIAVAKVTA